MANARSLIAKAGHYVGLVVIALVLDSCVANVTYLGNRRGLSATATPVVFDVTQYGAKGDGSTNNFKPFLNAWLEACESTVPAMLMVPKGTFVVGPVVFAGPCKSQVMVEVQGTVKAMGGSAFATPEWILFERVDNLILAGGGTFDGQGQAVWKNGGCSKSSHCNLPPTSLKFRQMNNTVVHHITSVNSKGFHIFLVKTNNFVFHHITLLAPDESPNTDGIHLSNADFVKILDSKIGTGDDCVSIGRGSNNVTVEGVVCGPGHGISIGSLGKYDNEEDVSGIHVRNCTFLGTDNGARIKTWGGSGPSKATDIIFENIVMENVKNPIIIDQHYGSKDKASRVEIRDVVFKNIRGTSITKQPVQLMCSSLVPCKGVNVVDINLSYTGSDTSHDNTSGTSGSTGAALCENADVIFGGHLNFPTCH